MLRSLILSCVALVLCCTLLTASARAQGQPFNQCGTIEAGVTCPKLFRADDQTLWLLDVSLTGIQVGRRVRVVGTADPSCITVCGQGNGCVIGSGLLPCVPLMPTFCSPGAPNSTGVPGMITATGSRVIADDDLTLTATDLPPGSFAFFLTSRTIGMPIMIPTSVGTLCLDGQIGRFQAQVGPVDANGQYAISTDTNLGVPTFSLTAMPTPQGLVPVMPGETWHFQCWHRDLAGGAVTSNFTEGFEITFQ